jgi:hypothetical protein
MDLCPHSLWQTEICAYTVCDCGNRSLFVINCVDTDPCLSQPVWKQIPVCHKLCVWTQIPVHTICDKQGSVPTQFATNMDLCPHSLWQTEICAYTICDKQVFVSSQLGHRSLFVINCVDTDPCLSQIVWTQIPVCHKLCGHRSLLVTNYVDTDPCLSQTVWKICFHTVCDKQGSVST